MAVPPKLLAVIALLADHGRLPRGQVGTVVEVLDAEHVLIEFAGPDGVTFAVQSVPAANLLELRHGPVASMAMD
ncbi:DUF4926 domain-containing protein [Dechloromonas sp. HYN0024]|uniref:DUF4926 domain-containing protein n=1 Tax=Dechloromonas sp. HYN0024 TaxID=2231055 RepID=UPI000E44E626|nr:DUF4926 domain-containing protein [Dechloromonas sp. HYN0024]AXS80153.1 DUF4926 domain-containing protein [Dechloromonas sp. HYN0024]